jgi:hypothetical protein
MFGLKRKAKEWRESFVAGVTNTGNVTATVGNKLVLNWHGTGTGHLLSGMVSYRCSR